MHTCPRTILVALLSLALTSGPSRSANVSGETLDGAASCHPGTTGSSPRPEPDGAVPIPESLPFAGTYRDSDSASVGSESWTTYLGDAGAPAAHAAFSPGAQSPGGTSREAHRLLAKGGGWERDADRG